MPHDITQFKVKELQDFKLNLLTIKAAIVVRGKDIIELDDLVIEDTRIGFFDCLEIEGQLNDDLFTINNFMSFHGGWSGIVWRDVLLPSFVTSKGIMKAVLIWEGGEKIERIEIRDGVVTSEEIDL